MGKHPEKLWLFKYALQLMYVDKTAKQRKAAKFVFNHYITDIYSSVSNMLQKLNWDSLEHRRTKAIILVFYKIINNIVSVNNRISFVGNS